MSDKWIQEIMLSHINVIAMFLDVIAMYTQWTCLTVHWPSNVGFTGGYVRVCGALGTRHVAHFPVVQC